MSGGTFDYVQFQVRDAIETIEERLSRNGKTVLELWNETPEDRRGLVSSYEKPWSIEDHPYWVDVMAEKEANKALNVTSSFLSSKDRTFNQLSKKELDKWNSIRLKKIKKCIDEQNNSFIGENYSEKTIETIKDMLVTIKKAEIYLQRIDWLFAGEDGESNFIERTEEDLKKAGLE